MRCTGLSVIKGTEISSFDVEILDVIAAETGLSGPRILIRVSGPAVDDTGIGPGFSGSPVYCDGRNAGAISEGLGEYGNEVALATPIEAMIRDRPPSPPSSAPPRPDAAAGRAPARHAADRQRPHRPRRGARQGGCAPRSPAAVRGARRPGGRLPARRPAPGRLGGGRDLDRRPRARRHRHGDIPRRRRPVGVRPSLRGARQARAVPSGRLRLHGHPEPARNPGLRRDHVQARLGGRQRAGRRDERQGGRDRRQGRRRQLIPLHIVARNRAGETVTQDSLLADERGPRLGRRHLVRRAARPHTGGGPADARFGPDLPCACASACASSAGRWASATSTSPSTTRSATCRRPATWSTSSASRPSTWSTSRSARGCRGVSRRK